jgi:peptidoglycan/xylan/chitin deacetylase (PgdA/CDA1 family)
MSETFNDAIRSKEVFLTFDDGPAEPCTSEILDVLKSFEAKATFFVCGKNVERYPDITRRIVNEGHSIGNHTYSHSNFLAMIGFWGNQIEVTARIIEETTGVKADLFRPPWGLLTPWLSYYAKRKGYRIFLWNVAAHDWQRPSAKSIQQRILRRVRPGSIILLHDGEKAHSCADRSQTVLALPSLIRELSQEGYAFKRL